MPSDCDARFETKSGEFVSPCDLPAGHEGDHMGYVLGSRCRWPQGCESEWDDDDRADDDAADRLDDGYDYYSSTKEIIEADQRDRWLGKMEYDGMEPTT